MTELFEHGYGLLIGVGADLPVSVKDATALAKLLTDPTRAAYPSTQVDLLTEAEASRQGILDGLNRLIGRVKSDPEATVIVYFSGHGGRLERQNQPPSYYLVAYGYDPGRRLETSVSGEMFADKIKAIQARKLIVLMDCCHAGGMPAPKAEQEGSVKAAPIPIELDKLELGSGRVIIASSLENEFSYTGDPNSVFTACLLDALGGRGSQKGDGYAHILEVISYLFDEVPKRAPGPQRPMVKQILDLGDNFPICYYAGGSKGLPWIVPKSEPGPIVMTSRRRMRLEMERDGLQAEWDLRSQKVKQLRADLAIETGSAIKFQLEQTILREQIKLAELDERLTEIEQELT
jgi:hypothetical protein